MYAQGIYLSCFCFAVIWCSVNSLNNGARQISTPDKFNCRGKQGFFADISSNCSSFYLCQLNRKLKLTCAHNLWFNQKLIRCVDGDRKLCKNSKKYYHINNKLLNLRKILEKPLHRSRRQIQTLYLPPSSINTFVVRYYLPTGSASVNEEDAFGNDGSIYLPEAYRVPMNPDSEIPIIQAKSPSQKDTRIQYLKDSNKQLATKEQNVKASTVKSNVENISTHKPEPKEQRVIHPTNNHRINEPRHRNSNYEENARNNPTHHPRKAGSKSYHPGDYSDPPIYREAAPTERSYGYNDYRQRYLNHPNNYYGEDEDDEDDDDYDYFHRERYSPRYPQPNRYVYSQNTPRYPESDSYPYSKVISVNNHNLNGERPQRPDIPQRPNVYSSPDGSRNQHSIDYQNENTKYWRPSENFRKPNENHKDYRDSAEHSRHNENNSEKYKTGNPETSFYDSDAKNISPDYNQNYKSNDPDNANSEKYHNERTYNKNEESDDATYSNSKNPDNLNNQDSAANYENYKDHTTKQPIRYNEFPRNKTAVCKHDENFLYSLNHALHLLAEQVRLHF
ncbi:GATA zinc finger domain-containing protein 14-like [Centruroides sculpturatus]|uniref:GATA zinc finger domain-containing protein 14-like n=1 Tax=Centruroides sculpturatus TaxID=218467 RepID=UPI000C6EA3D3|nr:GATA zinc finger domain-containing protein 14-like [Centruroides sculpturatus]